jgi:hypothetical protein
MSFVCPHCHKPYPVNTHDGMCELDDCWGHYLEPAAAVAKPAAPAPFPVAVGKTLEGLCVLACDVSGSMEEAAFATTPATKRALVTTAIDLAIRELAPITKSENAYIAIVVFGEGAALITDTKGRPFMKSIKQIVTEFPNRGDLAGYLDNFIVGDLAGVGRDRTNITAGLRLAKELFDATTGETRSLTKFGLSFPVDLISHDVYTSQGTMMAVPNIRIMVYSDGAHNPGDGIPLSNPFAAMTPSPLMTAFIGDEKAEGAQDGADQMNRLATRCPMHGHAGYFLINSIDRHTRLRNIFKMASGTSGFCPQCLASSIVEGKAV